MSKWVKLARAVKTPEESKQLLERIYSNAKWGVSKDMDDAIGILIGLEMKDDSTDTLSIELMDDDDFAI